jgi:uncharacterized membrane protein
MESKGSHNPNEKGAAVNEKGAAAGGKEEYREAIRKQVNSEIKKIFDLEIQKASEELAEENKKAIRQVVEEYRTTIHQVVEEEKKKIWEKAESLKKSMLNIDL